MSTDSIPLVSPAAADVFAALIGRRSATREELARSTGLSPGAVTRAVRPLLASGHLVEERTTTTSVGRPVHVLRPDGGRAVFLGVKLTGDEAIAAVVDLAGDVQQARDERLEDRSPEGVVDQIGRLADQMIGNRAIDRFPAAALAVSGDVSREDGRVHFSPFLGWRDIPLRALVEKRLRRPVLVDNDVRALTTMEQAIGLGVDREPFVLVTVGTGVGCGICVNGTVVEGVAGVSGELGHFPIEPAGNPCYCGAVGCLETVASDPALLATIRVTHPQVTDITAAIALARAGDPDVVAAFEHAGNALGRGLAAVVNLIGPRRVILTGEHAGESDPRTPAMRTSFREHAYGAAVNCEVIVRPHPFEDWARGAAVMALQRFIATQGRL